MAIKLFDSQGVALDQQRFTWKDLVQPPISTLDDAAFTRVRIILDNGLEIESLSARLTAIQGLSHEHMHIAQRPFLKTALAIRQIKLPQADKRLGITLRPHRLQIG